MTQEDKQLLLQDICGRLPYGVMFLCGNNIYVAKGIDLLLTDECEREYHVTSWSMEPVELKYIKPYLRPMSSMTEEEKNELFNLCTMGDSSVNTDWESFGVRIVDTHPRYADQYYTDYSVIDWLNKKMFDYRGLIQSNLAIDCSNLNIYD